MTENANNLQERQQYLASLQLMFTVALALGMLLAFQFAKRISDARPLHAEFAQTSAEVIELEAERDRLRGELAFIQSDAYVEIWARSEARMLRPGETFVFTIKSEPEIERTSIDNSEVSKKVNHANDDISRTGYLTNWQLWWRLFFAGAGPGRN